MKRRSGFNGGAPPTDLLVCFPSRARLTLMHKPICSPSRPNPHHSTRPALFRPNTSTAQPTNDHHHRAKTQMGSEIGSEPTSPKVTCAGQIKVRDKTRSAHRRRPDPKSGWIESLGIKKKDVAGFLAVLRGSLRLKFNMQCFGSFHGAAIDCSSDDDDEDEDAEDDAGGSGSPARNMISEWFMVLDEENHEGSSAAKNESHEEVKKLEDGPPKNALLLMRCRSAPAAKKGWLVGEGEGMKEKGEERREKEEELMLMSYAPDFFRLSTEIAKETWVVGNVDPLLARSRSCKR